MIREEDEHIAWEIMLEAYTESTKQLLYMNKLEYNVPFDDYKIKITYSLN